jgi:vaccinia related kinase
MSGEGEHKPYEEDLRRANNGTVEFTSRDAHIGALSRRSDLEVLSFNMVSWLSGGRLPWMSNLKDHKYVHECKKYYMDRLHELLNYAFDKTGGEAKASLKKSSSVSGASSASGGATDRSKLTVEVPAGLLEFLQYVVQLEFQEEPDYKHLKAILSKALKKAGGPQDGTFSFSLSKN